MKNPYKKTYIAVDTVQNGLFCAYVVPVTNMDNLLYKLRIKGIISANLCNTRKEAEQIVNSWNDRHRANGNSLLNYCGRDIIYSAAE